MELVRLGHLERTRGKGTVVTQPKVQPLLGLTSFSENMKASGITPSYNTLEVNWKSITSERIAESLAEEVGAEVLYIYRLLIAHGEPLALTSCYLPKRLLGNNAHLFTKETLNQHSLYNLLIEECGVELWRADEHIDASLASKEEAKLLGIPNYQPVIVIRRETFDKTDEPVEYVKLVFRGDRYRYRISLSRSRVSELTKEVKSTDV